MVVTKEAVEEEASAVRGTDAGLTGTVVETVVDGDWGGGLAVDNRDRRRGGTVDVQDGLKLLMGERQVVGGTNVVEGDGRWLLVGSRATGESTRGRYGRSRVAGDGVGRRPCCLGDVDGVGS